MATVGAMVEQFFGEPWNDSRIASKPHGPTPVGKECMHCGKHVQAGDQGVQMYATQQWGEGNKTLAPVHRECMDEYFS